ncbi:hypothetical protein KIPB_013255, partial [Kipferlia bialata]|eukprot:g13255.t1
MGRRQTSDTDKSSVDAEVPQHPLGGVDISVGGVVDETNVLVERETEREAEVSETSESDSDEGS